MQAELVHGKPLMVDYTPGADVAAGTVVVLGDTPRVSHLDISANRLGALAASGGVYKVPKATGGGSAIADGKKVYWDDGNDQITETGSGNAHFGYTIEASVDADTHQRVLHCPEADTPA